MTTTSPHTQTPEAFAERLFTSALGALESLSVYVGDRLGWYRALAEQGAATPAELAERTETHERYAREWLEQQAAYGLVDVAAAEPDRRYTLSPAAREVLTDSGSLNYLSPLPRMIAAAAVQLPALLDAYRTGGGVSWAQLGEDARASQADMNRPWFEHRLSAALSGVAHLHSVLSRPSVRIVDVGCGAGWSTMALARAYPQAEVEGVDVDAPSIAMAQAHAAAAGLSGQLRFRTADGAGLGAEGRYDAAFAFECVHDMPQPVEVLAAMRDAVRPDGAVVVMDEAVADEFSAPADEVERLMYGFSLLVCLPDGMSTQPSAATGTVMRPATLQRYAAQAGFSSVGVLPIEDFGFFRFYQLHH